MSEANSQRKRAIHFSEQVKSKLNSAYDDTSLNWEADSPPSLKFVIVRPKHVEMRLEYNATSDSFELYDRDAKTQRNETLGTFSPENITTPGDITPQEIVDKVKSYTG